MIADIIFDKKKEKKSHIPLLTQFKYDEKQRVPNRSVRYPNNPVSNIHFFLFTNISAAFCYNDRELNGAVYYIQTSGLTRYWYLNSERLLMILDNIETKYAEYWEKSDSNGNSVLDGTVFLSYEWDTFFFYFFHIFKSTFYFIFIFTNNWRIFLQCLFSFPSGSFKSNQNISFYFKIDENIRLTI